MKQSPWEVKKEKMSKKESKRKNPLMKPSKEPFGVPNFKEIEFQDLEPAIMAGLAGESEDWHRIATNPETPGVQNTVGAVDRAGALLDRATAAFWTLASSIGGPELDELQEKLAPLYAAHANEFYTNTAMYERYKAIAQRDDLDDETRYLVDQTIRDFERLGVGLNRKAKAKLRKLNEKIASLEAQIDTKISKQLVETASTGTDLAELDGLSDQELTAAAAAAQNGEAWRLGVMNYSLPPKLASVKDPLIRARLLEDSLNRGSTGNDSTDTRDLIAALVKAREKRARLLGFPSHAALVIDEETVPSPEAAKALLTDVGNAAKVALAKEAEKYRAAAAEDGTDLTVSDWPYYEEQARAAQLGFDADALKEYFELDRVVEQGIFLAANRLYGLTFKPRPDITGWSEDTRSWEVQDESGESVGLFMADYYARPGKSGGAWMSDLVPGSKRSKKLPVITNNANFTKPAEGEPTLLSWDDVETVFHEFGHALHGLLTDTYYDATAGTSVPRDFVELPSQLNEMWAFHPEVLGAYAKHWKTGEPLPQEVQAALAQSKFFGQPYATLEYVQSALIDQGWHGERDSLPGGPEEVDAFEAEILAASGVDDLLVVPRYRTPYFAHSFAGGYDAGYYSYMWAEAMVGELEEWLRERFKEDGGLNREAGDILREEILSRGSSRDPLTSFVKVRGHQPEGAAVVRRRGLTENVG